MITRRHIPLLVLTIIGVCSCLLVVLTYDRWAYRNSSLTRTTIFGQRSGEKYSLDRKQRWFWLPGLDYVTVELSVEEYRRIRNRSDFQTIELVSHGDMQNEHSLLFKD